MEFALVVIGIARATTPLPPRLNSRELGGPSTKGGDIRFGEFCFRMSRNVGGHGHFAFFDFLDDLLSVFGLILGVGQAPVGEVQVLPPFVDVIGHPPGYGSDPAVPRPPGLV